MRHTLPLIALLAALPVLADAASLGGTRPWAGCEAKRVYQREVVREVVRSWFDGATHAEGLLALVQAEQGIAACGGGRSSRLHTPSLPRGLALDQLGGYLLANELEWSGFMPAPESGLVGEFFRVAGPDPHAEAAAE